MQLFQILWIKLKTLLVELVVHAQFGQKSTHGSKPHGTIARAPTATKVDQYNHKNFVSVDSTVLLQQDKLRNNLV